MTAEKVLAVARAEIGTKEKPVNRVKYNTAYYGRDVSGEKYPWCAVFVWWCFRQAGASELLGAKTASCVTLLNRHKRERVEELLPGDVVFFDFNGNGKPDHVGICERYNGVTVTTIDGNTGQNEANGGAVMRKTRSKLLVCGAFRPKYKEDTMTQTEFDAMLEDWLARQARKEKSDWSELPKGITDGTRPRSFATREECATMIANALHRLADALK